MKKILLILILVLFISTVFASSITRIFPSELTPREETTIKLNVIIDGEDNYYLLEENVPQGIQIINASNDAGIVGQSIRWAEIQGATSTQLSYTVIIPDDGEYVFNGTYFVGGDYGSSDELIVQGAEKAYSTNTTDDQNPIDTQPTEPQPKNNSVEEFITLTIDIILILVIIALFAIITHKKRKKK